MSDRYIRHGKISIHFPFCRSFETQQMSVFLHLHVVRVAQKQRWKKRGGKKWKHLLGTLQSVPHHICQHQSMQKYFQDHYTELNVNAFIEGIAVD